MAVARETEVEEVEETAETEQETETPEVETEETVETTETEEETEEEADAEEEAEEPAAPPKPQTRGERRFQRLSNELAETRRKLEEIERRPAPADPNAAAEAARREAAEDEQVVLSGDTAAIVRHFTAKSERRLEGKLGSVVSHVIDAADKTEFRSLCAERPSLAAVAEQVEKDLAAARAQGSNPKREYLAYIRLGMNVAAREKGARTRQTRRAAEETRRQTARPGNARGDVARTAARGGRDTHAERAKRLDESGQL